FRGKIDRRYSAPAMPAKARPLLRVFHRIPAMGTDQLHGTEIPPSPLGGEGTGVRGDVTSAPSPRPSPPEGRGSVRLRPTPPLPRYLQRRREVGNSVAGAFAPRPAVPPPHLPHPILLARRRL